MALDATAFSEEFGNMFDAFAAQQKTFQDKFLAKLDDLGNAAGKGPVKEKTGFFGRPKAKAAPRQVKKEVIKVYIEDISNKVAIKLAGDEQSAEEARNEIPKSRMGLLSLIGGLLGAGAVAIIGSVFGAGAGAGTAAGLLAKVGKYIFAPLKLVAKRLPIIGSLFSFWEAYEHFKLGGVDNIMLGLLDVAAGFMYMIPGIGTAIGLGLDIVSYFVKERVEEHKVEGGDTSWLGSIYDKVIDYLSETDQIKWMVKLGELFGVLWGEPGKLDNWSKFFTHLGGLGYGVINLLKNFDKTVGTALGITDEKGEGKGLVAELISLVNEYVVDPLLEMIKSAFKYVKDGIVDAAKSVADQAKTAFSYTPQGWLAGKVKGYLDDRAATAMENAAADRKQMYKDLLMKKSEDMSAEEIKLRKEVVSKEGGYEKYKADRKSMLEGPSTFVPQLGGPMKDFAVINGELVNLPKSAIISGGRVQGFSGDDTVIGFKEGEALVTGINSLIEVGENQLKALKEYLETASQNVIAPTSNSSNTYNFSVETDVSSFRKLVT